MVVDPRYSSLVVSAYEIEGDGTNGPVGSVQPGVAAMDTKTGMLAVGRQINLPPNGHFNMARSNAGHDAAYVVDMGNGDVAIPYGAMSTYQGYNPSAAAACLGSYFCMPFKIASTVGTNPNAFMNALVDGNEYHLPSVGLSEASYAVSGSVTAFAGQEARTSPFGQPGTFGYVVYHTTGRSSGYFDTMDGDWDFHDNLASATDGLQTLTLAPKDNAYFEFVVQTINAGGTGTIFIAMGPNSCKLSPVEAQTPEQAALEFVQYFNTSSDPGCSSLRQRFRAIVPAYDTNERAGSTIGVDLRSGDVTALPPPPSGLCDNIVVICGSSLGVGRALDLRNSGYGEHRHFLDGGIIRIGSYFYALLDVNQVTHSWYGSGHSSFAGALACFRSKGPSGAIWTWTDCSGRQPFEAGPGIRPQLRLGTGARSNTEPASSYLIGPPQNGYPPTMVPFYYDYSMEAQPQYARLTDGKRVWPVISNVTMTGLDGTLWIAYQCYDTLGNISLCALEYNVSSGRTIQVGLVDRSSQGGSLGAVEFLNNTQGGLVLGALFGNGSKWGCSGGPCAVVYKLDLGSRTWRRVAQHSFGGKNYAGAPGIVTQSGDGKHLLFQSVFLPTDTQSITVYDYYLPTEK